MIAGAATRAALAVAADQVLVTDTQGARTGADLERAVDALAARLVRTATAGDGVGIWAWNSADSLVAHLAVERAGLTRVPADPEAPGVEVEAIMSEAGVRIVLIDDEHEAGWADVQIPVDAGLWPDVAEPADQTCPPVEVEESATAILVVRGVVNDALLSIPLSFGNWEAHMELAEHLFRSGAYGGPIDELCFLTVQQMQYGTGLVGTFAVLRMGFPQIIVRKFDPALVEAAVLTDGASVTFMVPGMVTRLAEHVARRQIGEWPLHIIYGGAPFPLAQMLAAIDVLGPSLTQLYGRFEGGWPLTMLTAEDHVEIAAGRHDLASSCGRQVPGIEIELRELPAGGERELRVKSGCVSAAYADPDGWCSLGDLATVDSDGYFALRGRADGMINTGSFHVYPNEVEAAIRAEFTALTAVTVSARPDPRWGQAVVADITWDSTADVPTLADLRSRLSTRLAKYKVPTICEHRVDGQHVDPEEGVTA